MMATFGANNFPAIIFQPFEYFSTIHGLLSLFYAHYAHKSR